MIVNFWEENMPFVNIRLVREKIADDPAGFRLPEPLLAVFRRPYEVFLRQ